MKRKHPSVWEMRRNCPSGKYAESIRPSGKYAGNLGIIVYYGVYYVENWRRLPRECGKLCGKCGKLGGILWKTIRNRTKNGYLRKSIRRNDGFSRHEKTVVGRS